MRTTAGRGTLWKIDEVAEERKEWPRVVPPQPVYEGVAVDTWHSTRVLGGERRAWKALEEGGGRR